MEPTLIKERSSEVRQALSKVAIIIFIGSFRQYLTSTENTLAITINTWYCDSLTIRQTLNSEGKQVSAFLGPHHE